MRKRQYKSDEDLRIKTLKSHVSTRTWDLISEIESEFGICRSETIENVYVQYLMMLKINARKDTQSAA